MELGLENILGEEDIREIENGLGLTEIHIDFFNRMMKKVSNYAPQSARMWMDQSVIKPVSKHTDYIQILYTPGHYVCCYFDTKTVFIYDSMNAGRLTKELEICLTYLLPEIDLKTVKFPKVQNQEKCDDCGVFSIAFAVSLMFGIKPNKVQYIQALMRVHLVKMFRATVIQHFPQDPEFYVHKIIPLPAALHRKSNAIRFRMYSKSQKTHFKRKELAGNTFKIDPKNIKAVNGNVKFSCVSSEHSSSRTTEQKIYEDLGNQLKNVKFNQNQSSMLTDINIGMNLPIKSEKVSIPRKRISIACQKNNQSSKLKKYSQQCAAQEESVIINDTYDHQNETNKNDGYYPRTITSLTKNSLGQKMDFNTFCNVCFHVENLIELCPEEYEIIINILISFIGEQELITGDKIYLCTTCSENLKNYDNFRKMCFMNLVHFRQIYKQLKKKLEMCKDPDLDIKLNEFVQENVCKRKKSANQSVNLSKPESTKSVSNIEETNSYVFEDGSSVNNTNTVYIKSEFCDESFNFEYPNSESVGEIREIHNYSDEGSFTINIKKEVVEETPTLEEIKSFHEFSTSSDNIETNLHSEIDLGITKIVLPPKEEQKYGVYLEKELEDEPNSCIASNKNLENKVLVSSKNSYNEKIITEISPKTPRSQNKIKNVAPEQKKPPRCNLCKKTFSAAWYLKFHRLVHTGEKPYECDICKKAFTSSGNRNRHRLTHTGEKVTLKYI